MPSSYRKTVEFFKLSWMALWRLCVLSIFVKTTFTLILFISVVFAAFMVFRWRKSLYIHPVWNILKKRPYWYSLGHSVHKKPWNTGTGSPKQTETSNTGVMTGYEPRKLKSIPVPTPQNHVRMFGKPGGGLHSANFSQKSIRLGVEGEESFAKILHSRSLLDRIDSYWSVAMPSSSGFIRDSKFNTDIDCVLVVGKKVYLIDIKMYMSGDGTYRNIDSENIALFDNTTGAIVQGSKKHLSKNMSMATDRFRSLLPRRYNVESHVVLVPTDRGMANVPPNTVFWPGDIPAWSVVDFMSKLSRDISKNATSEVEININSDLINLLNK